MMPRWRARKMGADGASPSKIRQQFSVFDSTRSSLYQLLADPKRRQSLYFRSVK
jgi:hypothetical protein